MVPDESDVVSINYNKAYQQCQYVVFLMVTQNKGT